MARGNDWTEREVDAIVEDYFNMLRDEMRGIKFNKSEHRRKLQLVLDDRNDRSVENKHQNISAILMNNGIPPIRGYAPLSSYQKLLEKKVLLYLAANPVLENYFETFANEVVDVVPATVNFASWQVKPPEPSDPKEIVKKKSYTPRKINYIEREQKNRSVGRAGEELAFEYEKWRLKNSGLSTLAKEVKWTARDDGDGAGYDILSKNPDGTNIYIEVKTTKLGKETPIFFSKTENNFSIDNKSAYHLYRVFDLKLNPKMFFLQGCFSDMCKMEIESFKGIF